MAFISPKIAAALLLASAGFVHGRTHNLPSLTDIVVETEPLSMLEELVVAAGLVDFFSGSDLVTVFAPTNTAFEDLSCAAPVLFGSLASDATWSTHLSSLLAYHVTAGRVTSSLLESGTITMLTQEPVVVDVSGSAPTLTDETGGVSTVVGPIDVMASNGVAHVIDRVLLPFWVTTNIVDVLGLEIPTSLTESPGSFSILMSLLVRVDLDCVLIESDGVGLTLFAPVDSAFDGVDASSFTDEQIAEILAYHVVKGVAVSSALTTGPVETLNGASVDVVVGENSVTVNGNAVVTVADVLANNGIIHVIDQILLPPL